MKATPWLLGIVLGAFVGGFVLEAGVLSLLLLVPALIWGQRERGRPLGLAGIILGIGAGAGGLVLLAARAAFTVVASRRARLRTHP